MKYFELIKSFVFKGIGLNRVFRCRKHSKSNLSNVSAANNTFFERHHISMEDVLRIVYYFSRDYQYKDVEHEIKRGIVNLSDFNVEEERGGISSETIADMYSYLREVIMLGLDAIFEDEGQLGGDGIEVQIDEMKYGH